MGVRTNRVILDLCYKIKWLIWHYAKPEDGVFVFPDGDSWEVKEEPK